MVVDAGRDPTMKARLTALSTHLDMAAERLDGVRAVAAPLEHTDMFGIRDEINDAYWLLVDAGKDVKLRLQAFSRAEGA